MATLTATAAAANAQAVYRENAVVARSVQFTVPGVALSAGDVIQMVKVPAGAVIQDMTITISSSVQSYTITGLGDGNNTTRYLASQSLVLVQAVRMSQPGGFGYAYSAEDTVDIVVGTVTSGTAANADIRLNISYTNMP